MKQPLLRLCLLAALGLAAPLPADEPIPARAGLQRLEDRFGREAVERLYEMTGVAGDPQPLEWRVTAPDLRRTDLLHEFWIGDTRATDEGVNDDFYPDRLPKGFFRLSRVKLDSTQAFAITEQIARDAGVGFDVVNYKLHCREYSDEPVWTLTLLDREEVIIGSVHLSADTGKVLRTVWLRRRANGHLSVDDSALQGLKIQAAVDAPAEPGDPAPPVPIEPQPRDPGAEIDPTPAPPPTLPPPSGDEEIPEIKKLNDAQEKTAPPKTGE